MYTEGDRVVDRHADRIDHLPEPGEVDRQPVVDLQARDRREHVGHEGAPRSSSVVVAVDEALAKTSLTFPFCGKRGDALDPQVARESGSRSVVSASGRSTGPGSSRRGTRRRARAAVPDHQDVDRRSPVERSEELRRRERRARDRRVEGRGPHPQQDPADDHRHERHSRTFRIVLKNGATAREDGPRGADPTRSIAPARRLPSLRRPARADQVAVVRQVVVALRVVSGHGFSCCGWGRSRWAATG